MSGDNRDLRGIGGWLFYFCLGQAGWIAFIAYDVLSTLSAIRDQPSVADVRASDIHAVIICDILMAFISFTGLVLAVRKHRRAPDFWVCATFALGWISLFRNAIVADLSHPTSGPTSEESGALLRGTMVMIAWFIYWLRSKRVAATYGSNGEIRKWLNRVWLDKAQPTPTPQ